MRLTILILILFSFSAFGNFVKESEVLDCEKIGKITYSKKKDCSGTCYKVPKKEKYCKTHSLFPIMIDGPVKIWSGAENIQTCEGFASCNDALAVLECPDLKGYDKFIEENYTSVYCTQHIGFEKIGSGQKELREDLAKKAVYLAQKKAEKDLLKSNKDKIIAIRNKINDGDLTIAEIGKALKFLLKNLK